MSDRVDWLIQRDRTFRRTIAVKVGGAPVDLTGWTLRVVARNAGGVAIVDKSVAMDSDGASDFVVTAAETAALTAGSYSYDVHRRNAGEAIAMFSGLIVVEDTVGGV